MTARRHSLLRLKKAMRRENGSMAVEMALFLFFFSTLFLGAFEVPRFLLIGQKMERAAATMADLVAQVDPALGNVKGKIDDLFVAADRLLSPYDMATSGRVIISSIGNPDGNGAKIMWQMKSPGSFAATSEIGAVSETPALPTGLVVRSGENIIVSEVFFRYEPLFGSMIYSGRTLYTRSFTRPRFTSLTATPTNS
jgi:hypothetical protein